MASHPQPPDILHFVLFHLLTHSQKALPQTDRPVFSTFYNSNQISIDWMVQQAWSKIYLQPSHAALKRSSMWFQANYLDWDKHMYM